MDRYGWARVGLLLGLAAGLPGGVGAYTFWYARGASYLTNAPAACANCHIMQGYYDGWLASSHHQVAVCNDCHTPHALIPKYYTKGLNGYHHSLAFTTGNFHEPILITPRNHGITEQACRRCHQDIVQLMDRPMAAAGESADDGQSLSCVRCHASVGHLR